MAWKNLGGEVAEMFAEAAGGTRVEDAYERWSSWKRQRCKETRTRPTREQLRRYRITRRKNERQVIAAIRSRNAIPALPYVGRTWKLEKRIRKIKIAVLAKKRGWT